MATADDTRAAPAQAFTDSVWQSAADACDRINELMDGMPAGADGYQLAPESEADLREGVALLERALVFLERAHERETPRYEAWSHQHAWAETPDRATQQ
jgi:hypothetical protein